MESLSWIEPGPWWEETKRETKTSPWWSETTMENSKKPLNEDGMLAYTSFSSIYYKQRGMYL
jgi:hypothetical protein